MRTSANPSSRAHDLMARASVDKLLSETVIKHCLTASSGKQLHRCSRQHKKEAILRDAAL
jgi:hypothetical protein